MEKLNRKITLTIPLEKVAQMFKYKLEADDHEDVFHNGYSKKDIKNMNLDIPKELEGVELIFPDVVAISCEMEDRASLAREIVKQNKIALIEALEKINPGKVEYMDDNQEMITIEAGIVSAEINEEDQTVQVEIQNPEHLINAMLVGEGMFGPELSTEEAESNEKLISYFHNLEKYFDIYGESKPQVPDRMEASSYDKEYFQEDLKERIANLSEEEVAMALIELKQNNELDLKLVKKVVKNNTSVDMNRVKELILDLVESEVNFWQKTLK